jgi:hypothetical protein
METFDLQPKASRIQRLSNITIPGAFRAGDDSVVPGTFHGGDEVVKGSFHGGDDSVVPGSFHSDS